MLQLEDLNIAYEGEVADTPFFCRKGCASCCTRSVNMTTAEGVRILDYLSENCMSLPDLNQLTDIPIPASTTNHAAACYLEGKIPPESDANPWNFLPCLFLDDDACIIYPVRPFGCRSFGSLSDCREMQSAEAPEWFISLNLFVMQIVEWLDHPGFWGNMFEVFAYLTDKRDESNLLKTEDIPGFLVPDNDRLRVISYIARLKEALGDDESLNELRTLLGRSIKGR